jgi:hypothetical protein
MGEPAACCVNPCTDEGKATPIIHPEVPEVPVCWPADAPGPEVCPQWEQAIEANEIL